MHACDMTRPPARTAVRVGGLLGGLDTRNAKTVHGSKRDEPCALFAANRRLFKAYVLREHLDHLWTYKTRDGVATFLWGWFKVLRWQRLPEMEI